MMRVAELTAPGGRLARITGYTVWIGVAGFFGLVFSYLISAGLWYVCLVLLAAVPAFVWFHRFPIGGVALWIAVVPLVTATASPALRQVFWILHRALPLGVLVLIVVGSALRTSPRRLGRLGRAETLMLAFILSGLVSIAMLSAEPLAQTVLFYDRWIAPMCLYLIVRLLEPSSRELRWLIPVAVGLLLLEAPVGVATLTVPHLLPAEWVILTRATGTFGDPDVLGAAMAFCGVICLWAGTITRRPVLRAGSILLFVLAMLMMFLTFSRANWLAGVVVIAACAWIFRERLGALVVAGPMVIAVLLVTGLLAGPLAFAEERFASQRSQESALARLPVAVAAVRMFEARPLTGWGYGNFDLYSRDFQGTVGNLVTAEKNHASHNLFLSIIAELGLIGLVAFLGPMFIWARRTMRAYPHMPLDVRRFAAALWLVVGSFIIVNNFSVMKSTYGLGLWWLCLGFIATTVGRYHTTSPARWGLEPDLKKGAA